MIYSSLPVISAIEPQLNTSSMTDALKEVSQKLLIRNMNFEYYDNFDFVRHPFSFLGSSRVVRD